MVDPTPVRLRLSRVKGFDLQAVSRATNGLPAVNCARPSRWGNPWKIAKAREAGFTGTDTELAAMCVGSFRNAVERGLPAAPSVAAIRSALAGKNLACWCPLPAPGEPDHCHAAVLLEIANRPEAA